jgi:poly-gamma-glutamate capsule biosynthesis protein CapA/YwtB (metallophosphatase superfamily)
MIDLQARQIMEDYKQQLKTAAKGDRIIKVRKTVNRLAEIVTGKVNQKSPGKYQGEQIYNLFTLLRLQYICIYGLVFY